MRIGDRYITIGADPELPLRDRGTGKFVSAHGLIPGDKMNPHPVKNGAVQVDGMAVEFNIDPAKSAATFVKNTLSVMSQLRDMLPNHIEMVPLSCVTYDQDVWDNTPEEAKVLGCEPDYNAYNGEANIKPDGDVDFRTFSGHIHIGWGEGFDVNDEDHIEDCKILCRELDAVLAAPFKLIDNSSLSSKRRALYGGAGCFRPKSYGVEYRTLSNKWLERPEYMKWVFRTTSKAYANLVRGNPKFTGFPPVRHQLNNPKPRYFNGNFHIDLMRRGIEVPEGLV